MIKLIIFLVLGLAVGIGGGTAASVMKARKAFATYEAGKAKAVADSIAKDAEHPKGDVATTEHGAPAEDSVKTFRDSTSHGAPDSTSHGAPGSTSHGAPETAPHGPPEVPATPDRGAHGAPKPQVTATAPTTGHDAPAPTPTKPSKTSKAVETIVAGGSTDRPHLAALPPKPAAAIIASTQSEKVARIFGAMPAKDAAKVLEQLEDSEVQSILTGLSDKQAAGIMLHLPPARAASISKLVLRGGHE